MIKMTSLSSKISKDDIWNKDKNDVIVEQKFKWCHWNKNKNYVIVEQNSNDVIEIKIQMTSISVSWKLTWYCTSVHRPGRLAQCSPQKTERSIGLRIWRLVFDPAYINSTPDVLWISQGALAVVDITPYGIADFLTAPVTGAVLDPQGPALCVHTGDVFNAEGIIRRGLKPLDPSLYRMCCCSNARISS